MNWPCNLADVYSWLQWALMDLHRQLSIIIFQIDDSIHWIRQDFPRKWRFFHRFPALNVHFQLDPIGKGIRRCKQYSSSNVVAHRKTKIRKFPFTGLSQKITRIRVRNQSELNISLGDWVEYFVPQMDIRWNTSVSEGSLIKIIQNFSGHINTNEKSFKDLNETFLISKYFRDWSITNDILTPLENLRID